MVPELKASSADEYDHLIPDDYVQITDYREAIEIYRHRAFRQVVDRGTAMYRADTLLRTDGSPHHRRRRTMSALVKRDGHLWFREQVLVPTADRMVGDLLSTAGPDGCVRCDFSVFARQVFIAIACGLVGLNRIESDEEGRELVELVDAIFGVLSLRWHLGDKSLVVARGLEAKREFDQRFYQPALERHRALVAEVEAGRREQSDVPSDLLSLIAAFADPAWADDPELGLRETIVTLNATLDTSGVILVQALAEAFRWFQEHPEDEPLQTDPDFLSGLVQETLRLHPTNTAFFRRTAEAVTLKSGRQLKAGDMIAIRVGVASRDPAVYGADADRFDPRRRAPSGNAYDYGLAFGSGAHMCLGLPLILGAEGREGSHVHLLRMLFAAHIAPDPDRPAIRPAELDRDMYETFPVVLQARQSAVTAA